MHQCNRLHKYGDLREIRLCFAALTFIPNCGSFPCQASWKWDPIARQEVWDFFKQGRNKRDAFTVVVKREKNKLKRKWLSGILMPNWGKKNHKSFHVADTERWTSALFHHRQSSSPSKQPSDSKIKKDWQTALLMVAKTLAILFPRFPFLTSFAVEGVVFLWNVCIKVFWRTTQQGWHLHPQKSTIAVISKRSDGI